MREKYQRTFPRYFWKADCGLLYHCKIVTRSDEKKEWVWKTT